MGFLFRQQYPDVSTYKIEAYKDSPSEHGSLKYSIVSLFRYFLSYFILLF